MLSENTIKDVLFINDGSVFSKLYAKQLSGEGHILHSIFARFGSDGVENEIKAQEIADLYCATHNKVVVTIPNVGLEEIVRGETIVDKTIFLILIGPLAVTYFRHKYTPDLWREIYFGVQWTEYEKQKAPEEFMTFNSVTKNRIIFMPTITEEEALVALGGEI